MLLTVTVEVRAMIFSPFRFLGCWLCTLCRVRFSLSTCLILRAFSRCASLAKNSGFLLPPYRGDYVSFVLVTAVIGGGCEKWEIWRYIMVLTVGHARLRRVINEGVRFIVSAIIGVRCRGVARERGSQIPMPL